MGAGFEVYSLQFAAKGAIAEPRYRSPVPRLPPQDRFTFHVENRNWQLAIGDWPNAEPQDRSTILVKAGALVVWPRAESRQPRAPSLESGNGGKTSGICPTAGPSPDSHQVRKRSQSFVVWLTIVKKGEVVMAKKRLPIHRVKTSAQPRFHQSAPEIQPYGAVNHMLPLDLEEPVRLEMTEQLNQLLADTITIRDLYKKCHWQVSGPTFYQLHLLFDKHFESQAELVDAIAERIQMLGGISLAMAADVAETTQIARPPRGREEVPVQLSRLLDAHQVIVEDCRKLARRATQLGDDGTNDLVVSQVLRSNEMQIWFLSEHLVNMPLVKAEGETVYLRSKPA